MAEGKRGNDGPELAQPACACAAKAGGTGHGTVRLAPWVREMPEAFVEKIGRIPFAVHYPREMFGVKGRRSSESHS